MNFLHTNYFLQGLFELHKRYGKLKWAEVVQPVIDIAENGFVVNEKLAVFYVSYATRLNAKPFFRYEIILIL